MVPDGAATKLPNLKSSRFPSKSDPADHSGKTPSDGLHMVITLLAACQRATHTLQHELYFINSTGFVDQLSDQIW